jgi:uncharacterized lipoprotein YmbA
MMRVGIPCAALLIVVASCASTPDLSYHSLDMTPSGNVDPTVNLAVEKFAVTEMLDRSQIVIQHSATRIEFYATDRWASSVGELVQRKLAAEFGPGVEGRRTLKVSGRVVAFEQIDAGGGPIGRVRLEVTIRAAETKRFEEPLLERVFEAEREADTDDVDGVIRALSRAVESIAVEVAAAAGDL